MIGIRTVIFLIVLGRPDALIWPPCAPDEFSNNRFYDAFFGPTWFINATDYGHGDMLEPEILVTLRASGICASNLGMEIEDDTFRHAIAGEIVAFLRGNNPFFILLDIIV